MTDKESNNKPADEAKPSVVDPLINKYNLALLRKRDRTIIMGVGLVMSLAGSAIATLGANAGTTDPF